MRSILKRTALTFSMIVSVNLATAAGVPVIDVANLVNSAQQVAAWSEQYLQMVNQLDLTKRQLEQSQAQLKSFTGSRGGLLSATNPALSRYLPKTWTETANLAKSSSGFDGLTNSIKTVRDAARIASLEDLGIAPNSRAAKSIEASQLQAATNQVIGESGLAAATARIDAIQMLMDKVSDSPDPKDVLDLQARINAEQLMVENEQVRLSLIAQLQASQRETAIQQGKEMAIRSTKGPMPPGW